MYWTWLVQVELVRSCVSRKRRNTQLMSWSKVNAWKHNAEIRPITVHWSKYDSSAGSQLSQSYSASDGRAPRVCWRFIPLDMKGCICLLKWQIHPFISKGTMCLHQSVQFYTYFANASAKSMVVNPDLTVHVIDLVTPWARSFLPRFHGTVVVIEPRFKWLTLVIHQKYNVWENVHQTHWAFSKYPT